MACVVCDKIKERKALIVYEDDNLVAVLPSKPAMPGHIKIMTKQHFTKLEEMSNDLIEELFFLANFSSAAVFDTVRAHGTNILLTESDNHLAVDVIPRKEGDGLNFLWKPKQLTPEEMNEVHSKIKDKAFVVGKSEEKTASELADSENIRFLKKEVPKEIGDMKKAAGQITHPQPAVGEEKKEEKPDEVIKIPKENKVNYLIKHLFKIP